MGCEGFTCEGTRSPCDNNLNNLLYEILGNTYFLLPTFLGGGGSFPKTFTIKIALGTSLVAQWLRIRLPGLPWWHSG